MIIFIIGNPGWRRENLKALIKIAFIDQPIIELNQFNAVFENISDVNEPAIILFDHALKIDYEYSFKSIREKLPNSYVIQLVELPARTISANHDSIPDAVLVNGFSVDQLFFTIKHAIDKFSTLDFGKYRAYS